MTVGGMGGPGKWACSVSIQQTVRDTKSAHKRKPREKWACSARNGCAGFSSRKPCDLRARALPDTAIGNGALEEEAEEEKETKKAPIGRLAFPGRGFALRGKTLR